ncbi:hypothetical protein [Streptomyces niveus]|uniref:Uncharacterized protein n=1 Tax=Streptomyces niveus TaxID=193462 RepID=A0A1U9QKX2_STRNV|nr:hypothetical protein [Streptomyces niveus]AQU64912.1 hypothetical protein BBN63_00145 [Streptomyces niveus]
MNDKANKLNFAPSDWAAIVEAATEEWNNAPDGRTAGVNFGSRTQTAMDNGEAWAISIARLSCAVIGRRIMSDLLKAWASVPVDVGGGTGTRGLTTGTPGPTTGTTELPPGTDGGKEMGKNPPGLIPQQTAGPQPPVYVQTGLDIDVECAILQRKLLARMEQVRAEQEQGKSRVARERAAGGARTAELRTLREVKRAMGTIREHWKRQSQERDFDAMLKLAGVTLESLALSEEGADWVRRNWAVGE